MEVNWDELQDKIFDIIEQEQARIGTKSHDTFIDTSISYVQNTEGENCLNF